MYTMETSKSSKIVFTLPEAMSDLETGYTLVLNIEQRLFSPRDLKISPRVFQHWKDFGLMPFPMEPDKWIRINFFEYIWANIICDLRKMGYPLPLIKKLRDILFEEIPNDSINPMIEQDPELIDKILDKMGLDSEEKKNLNREELKASVQKTYSSVSIFKVMLLNSLLYKFNNTIYITSEEDIYIWLDEYQKQPDKIIRLQNVLNKPHISIPLTHYIFNFIDDKSKESFLSPFAALNEEELNVLKAIRNMEFKEVIIKPVKVKGSGKKYDIITVKNGELSEEQQKQITEILSLKNYQSITLKKRNNSSIYFERENRR